MAAGKREFLERVVEDLNLDIRDPFTLLLANAMALADQRDALKAELSTHQSAIEEAEGRCCPEDVGFEEWIGMLRKRDNVVAHTHLQEIVSLLLQTMVPIGPMRERTDYPVELQRAIDFLHGRVDQSAGVARVVAHPDKEPDLYLCCADGEGSHEFKVCRGYEDVAAFYETMCGRDADDTLDSLRRTFDDADEWRNDGAALKLELYCAAFYVWKVSASELGMPCASVRILPPDRHCLRAMTDGRCSAPDCMCPVIQPAADRSADPA